MTITQAQLKKFAPNGRVDVLQAFTEHADEIEAAGITTPLRIRHFMAQIAVESQGLSRLEENLNYSAKRLTEVWPKRFPSIAAAAPYAKNPRALANKTYGGRLGNIKPNDGWDYRGSGLMGTTGRDNFRDAGHEDDPDTLRQPVGALRSALQYWSDNNLNKLADADNITAIRKAIQGGTLGLDDARTYLARAKKIFV